jgi:hypothetical protein
MEGWVRNILPFLGAKTGMCECLEELCDFMDWREVIPNSPEKAPENVGFRDG